MKFLISVLLILSIHSFSGDFKKSTPELIAKGKESYGKNCVLCHGDKMDGNGPAGAGMSPKPRNLITEKYLAKGGDKPDAIFNSISNGYTGKSVMPPFAGTITSEEERWAIVHYILSMRKKK